MKAKGRIGEENFVSCMRKALLSQYGENPVGLGGVFQIKTGKAKLHVMVITPNHRHSILRNMPKPSRTFNPVITLNFLQITARLLLKTH